MSTSCWIQRDWYFLCLLTRGGMAELRILFSHLGSRLAGYLPILLPFFPEHTARRHFQWSSGWYSVCTNDAAFILVPRPLLDYVSFLMLFLSFPIQMALVTVLENMYWRQQTRFQKVLSTNEEHKFGDLCEPKNKFLSCCSICSLSVCYK